MELFWRASMGVQIVMLESLNVAVLASLKRGSANRGFGEPQPTKYPPCSDASVLGLALLSGLEQIRDLRQHWMPFMFNACVHG